MKKILCLGDSNTYGFDPRGFGGGRYEHPWPELLEMMLTAKAEEIRDTDPEHRGSGGSTCDTDPEHRGSEFSTCDTDPEHRGSGFSTCDTDPEHRGSGFSTCDMDPEHRGSGGSTCVINLGLNGREFPAHERQQLLLDSMIERELPADWLIILLGTNDLLNLNGDVLGQVRSRMDRWAAHLREKYPEQRILWMTPPPCPELEVWDPGMLAQSVPDYRRTAEKYSMDFLDLSEEPLDLAYDGVHLSGKGHRQLAELVASCL